MAAPFKCDLLRHTLADMYSNMHQSKALGLSTCMFAVFSCHIMKKILVKMTLLGWGIVYICRGYSMKKSLYHCDRSRWSISNNFWVLMVGHAVFAFVSGEVFIGNRHKRLGQSMETFVCSLNHASSKESKRNYQVKHNSSSP